MKEKIWGDEIDAALQVSASRYTHERYRFEARYLLSPAERRFSELAWKDMAEMGWLSVSTPESQGGLGVRLGSVCLLAEVAGRALVNEPLVSSGFLAPFLVAHCGTPSQRAEWLPKMLNGELRVACTLQTETTGFRLQSGALYGVQTVVIDADMADQLLVLANDGDASHYYLVDLNDPTVDRKTYPLLDGRGAATVTLSGTTAISLGDAPAGSPARSVKWLAAIATAGDSYGAMVAAFDLTLNYLKTRQQFGRTLGTYQALQHRAVDMHIQLSECRAVLDQAIESVQTDAASAASDVHAAKAFICETARKLTQEAVQLHGGIGITDEYALSHYLRRARVNEQLYGSAEHHQQSFAALLN
jgi:alkylation response protein AidB-like acyl-CoA dehydrogenase